MSDFRDDIIQQALRLSAEDRSLIANRLLQSLSEEIDPAVDAAWAEEVERRIDAFDRGESTAISVEEVMKQLRHRKSA